MATDEVTASGHQSTRDQAEVFDPVRDHQIALVWFSIITFVLVLPMPVSTVPLLGEAPLRGYQALLLGAVTVIPPPRESKWWTPPEFQLETADKWIPKMIEKGWARSERLSLLLTPWFANLLLAAVWICGFRRWSVGMTVCGSAGLALGLTALYFFAKFPFEIGFGAWIVSLSFACLAGLVAPVTWLTSSIGRLVPWYANAP